MELLSNLRYLKGIGEKKSALFNKLGIFTVNDLLYHLPRDLEDRSEIKSISQLIDGETVCVKVMFAESIKSYKIRNGLNVVKSSVTDGSGMMKVTWFNSPYIAKNINAELEYILFGKVTYKGPFCEMVNPIIEKADSFGRLTGRIVPIYPLTASLTQRDMRNAVEYALKELIEEIPESLPSTIMQKYDLVSINEAMQNIHMPKSFELFEKARYRLVFEELLELQLGISLVKEEKKKYIAHSFSDVKCVADFANSLKFELTNAQKRVINEICSDLRKNTAMNRLVQGDVGSGKTIVAAAAMFSAVKSGFQAAMMVPTEILAKQHFKNLSNLFSPWGISVTLLTGGLKASEKRESLEKIKSGYANIIIGTHALITDNVEFKNLALTVTDEQHRFGVRQRTNLASKGEMVHNLVMTATPIPRTLSLVVYGDLDISVIDELPPGRKEIETFAVDENMRVRINNFITKKINEGRQIYIVCPLVEESEALQAKAAIEYAENLKKKVFNNFKIGLIYGKMKSKDKDEVMSAFLDRELDILVSTTVIEVGVDIPNAAVMVIENAERFGLSQLHQLRGRIGRGKYQSYCILFCTDGGKIAKERMKVMSETNDGFKIAEKDLEIRGPGEFFGTRQHGLPEMKIANLFTDMNILKDTQNAAKEILGDDSTLSKSYNLNLKQKIEKSFKKAEFSGLLN